MDEKGFESMNVIPLVDVMLVLLTIVLTTSTFIAVGSIPVKLPEAENSEAAIQQATTVVITRDGILFIDDRPVSIAEFKTCMTACERETPVVIRADRQLALQVFVDVMDVVKGLGFQKVSLQTMGGT